MNHNAQVEQLKFKNDQILQFKSVPTTEDYRRFLAKIDPGRVKPESSKAKFAAKKNRRKSPSAKK